MKEHITRAVMTLKANKRIPEDCRDLSPGGYHVKDRAGKEYGFDFNWSHGDIDSQDPTKVHFEVWDPDTASFPELSDLPDHLEEITDGLACRVITFGLDPSADYSAAGVSHDDMGDASFDLIRRGENCGRIRLSVKGDHNICNALSVIAVADLLGVSLEDTQKGLASFTGTDRRFEHKGDWNGVTVIDDYAHHPTEIRATLMAAKAYPHREVWCVFQPHTYTRTKALFDDFAEVLTLADHVVLADIYAARETDTLGISSALLADAVKERGGDSYYLPSFEAIEEFLASHCEKGDLLITMGAGNVVNIGEDLLKG